MRSVWSQQFKNDYWNGQSGLRTMALLLCWIQIGLKGFLIFYLFLDFKGKNPNDANYLFNFNYQTSQNQNNSNNKTAQPEDFGKNPYDE